MKEYHMSLDDSAAMFVRILGEKLRPLRGIVKRKEAARNLEEPMRDVAEAALQMAGFLKWAGARAAKKAVKQGSNKV